MVALFVKEDGIYVNNIPSEPHVCMSYVFGHCLLTVCKCHDEQKVYERMMEAAKDTAIKCVDQEQAKKLCWENDRPRLQTTCAQILPCKGRGEDC